MQNILVLPLHTVPEHLIGGGAVRGDPLHDPAHDWLRRRQGRASRTGQSLEGRVSHGAGEAQAAAGRAGGRQVAALALQPIPSKGRCQQSGSCCLAALLPPSFHTLGQTATRVIPLLLKGSMI